MTRKSYRRRPVPAGIHRAKITDMNRRLLLGLLAACLTAAAQSLSVEKLEAFIKSSIQLKMTDKEVAGYLSKVKLTDRLDDRTVEDMQGLGIGPKTLEALKALETQSQALAIKTVVPEAKPAPIPPPSAEEQAAIITEVREYALNYSKSLPNFICTQVVRRYQAPLPGTKYGGRAGDDPRWFAQDTLTARLSYFEQKEDYKLILINNTPTTQQYQALGGAISTGEFGSMLREIFEPATAAHLEWDHWGTLRGRRVLAFAYRVAQPNSQWTVEHDRKERVTPGYKGLIEVDRDTHMVLRVTLEADGMPAEFPVRVARQTLDYDFTDIGDQQFLLPVRSQLFMQADDILSRSEEEFRLYHKYSADTEIQYDTPDPLPDSQTKEQPLPQPK